MKTNQKLPNSNSSTNHQLSHYRVLSASILAALSFIPAHGQCATFALAANARVEGPAAGTDSVVLADASNTDTWSATANDSWLHLNQVSGTGSATVVFTFDANTGATRTGTLTIAGQTLTVTQAGSTYVAFPIQATTLATGLGSPSGLAADPAGNIYVKDTSNSIVDLWSAASNTFAPLVSMPSYLTFEDSIAADASGNLYFPDPGDAGIQVWTAATNAWSVLSSSDVPVYYPYAVGLDGTGNLYIVNDDNDSLNEWSVTNGTVSVLRQTSLDSYADVLAVDAAGNAYFDDPSTGNINVLPPTGNPLPLITGGIGYSVTGLAVDGAGNLYIATGSSSILKWTAANNTLTSLLSQGVSAVYGLAVDASGNVYYGDTGNATFGEVLTALVDTTAKSEAGNAGQDALNPVLPTTANLQGQFAPTSDQSWLTITGVTNGVVSFAFTANSSPTNRTANLNVLGQIIPVTQAFVTTTNTPPPGNGNGNNGLGGGNGNGNGGTGKGNGKGNGKH